MSFAAALREFLSEDQVVTDPKNVEPYANDWTKGFTGNASVVILPRSTEEIQKIVLCAREHQVALVPSGGRTSLAASATATNGEAVLSLEKMNRIIEIEPTEQTITCQAGVITQQLQEAVKEHGLMFPVSLASQGSSQIGGNVSTNAGGIHVIKYGCTRKWVLGLTVVTGEGKILQTGGKLYKDQTGYDLRNLFVGAEGTLGVISEVTLALTQQPADLTRILCGVPSFSALLELMRRSRAALPDISAFEFFTERALSIVLKHHPLRDPFSERHPFYGLIEIEESPEQCLDAIEQLCGPLLEDETISDVVISQNSQQADEFMKLRELIGETLSTHYSPHKDDLSIPVGKLEVFLDRLDTLLKKEFPQFEPVHFGHLGDGNIHLNIPKPEGIEREAFTELAHQADFKIYGLLAELGGSVSAEHGIGLLKRDFLHFSRSEDEIQYMKAVKKIFDPDGILNPGKIFPA